MPETMDYQGPDYEHLFRSLSERWRELCERYLPIRVRDSIWRYSRGLSLNDAEQGWKLHLSASALTANATMERVAPVLQRLNLLFKAPLSLQELDKLNSGIYYGYCQIGKVITVYPQTPEEAVKLARLLHRLTRDLAGPTVPFDLKFRPRGCLYYRYGSFSALEIEKEDGTRVQAIRDPNGKLVEDRRDSPKAMPDWVTDPFALKRPARQQKAVETPLKRRFRAFCALSQRGKGGVYKALDVETWPPRLCILKEGRENGETSLDGLDGYERVRHEGRVLKALRSAGLDVPCLYASFKGERNYYLALEYIEGESLDQWLRHRKRRLPIAGAISYSIEISNIIAQIHSAGWVWRDCKLTNLIVTKHGKIRALDFEGSCPVGRPDPMPWGSPSYVPPECSDHFRGQSRVPEDLYALGVIMYLLLTGCLPEGALRPPVEDLRRGVPPYITKIVEQLLDTDPARRPCASKVTRGLKAALRKIKPRNCEL